MYKVNRVSNGQTTTLRVVHSEKEAKEMVDIFDSLKSKNSKVIYQFVKFK
jgi:hypothetical protein